MGGMGERRSSNTTGGETRAALLGRDGAARAESTVEIAKAAGS
jgi:hypothetical protein